MKSSMTVSQIKTMFEGARHRATPLRDRMARGYRYVIGDQISDSVREQLRLDRRPESITNLTHNIILTVAGQIAGNTARMRAKPMRMGDEQMAGVRTVVTGDWGIGDKGYYEVAKASLDAAIGAVGWVNMNWDTGDDVLGRPDVGSYDPFMVWFDHDARRVDQKDWNWMFASGWYGVEKIISMLEVDDETAGVMRAKAAELEGRRVEDVRTDIPTSWAERTGGAFKDFWDKGRESGEPRVSYANQQPIIGTSLDYQDTRAGLYRVVELHDRREVKRMWIYDLNSGEKEIVEEGRERDEPFVAAIMKKFIRPVQRWVNTTQIWRTAIVPALLPDAPAMERAYKVQGKGFKLKPIFCYDFHPDLLKTQSIMDVMISPQDSHNQRHMSMLEWLLKAANPDIWYPQNSIDEADMDDWLSKKRAKLLRYKVVGGKAPEEHAPGANAISVMENLSKEAAGMIPQLTGITPAMQGWNDSSKKSGILFAHELRASMVNLAYLNRHIMEAMKEVFAYTDGLIQAYLTVPRAVRLLQEPVGMPGVEVKGEGDNKVYWMKLNWPTIDGLLNDYSAGDYDWVPDTMHMGSTEKQMKFLEGLEIVKILEPEDRSVLMPFIIEQWDNPFSQQMAQLMRDRQQGSMQKQQEAEEMQKAGATVELQMKTTRLQAERAKLMMMGRQMQMQSTDRLEGIV